MQIDYPKRVTSKVYPKPLNYHERDETGQAKPIILKGTLNVAAKAEAPVPPQSRPFAWRFPLAPWSLAIGVKRAACPLPSHGKEEAMGASGGTAAT